MKMLLDENMSDPPLAARLGLAVTTPSLLLTWDCCPPRIREC